MKHKVRDGEAFYRFVVITFKVAFNLELISTVSYGLLPELMLHKCTCNASKVQRGKPQIVDMGVAIGSGVSSAGDTNQNKIAFSQKMQNAVWIEKEQIQQRFQPKGYSVRTLPRPMANQNLHFTLGNCHAFVYLP